MIAGLSVGATDPALKRLERAGLIEAERSGRRKQEFSLTSSGRRMLADIMPNVIAAAVEKGPAEVESLFRILCLALRVGKNTAAAKTMQAAIARREQRRGERGVYRKPPSDSGASMYRWMISLWEAEKTRAEIRALLKISRKLHA